MAPALVYFSSFKCLIIVRAGAGLPVLELCELDLCLLLESMFFGKDVEKHFWVLLFCLYAKKFAEVTFLIKEAEYQE